jgi:sugar lactone lactonase YvrE
MKIKLSLSILVALMTFGVLSAAPPRPLGDSKVFAKVPAVPGFPEGVAIRGQRVYVTGPANFGIFTPSVVLAYNRKNGHLERAFPITLQDPNPAVMKSLSAGNFGPDGKLYVPEPSMGAVLRLDLDKHNTQSVYAGPFPAPGGPGTSLLNDLVFDAAGNMYVTDSFQATIFRVPPGGGTPTVWFTDPRLAGDPDVPFGVNGIRIDKKAKKLYVSVTAENGTMDGVIYRLPLVESPTAADLHEVHRYSFPDPAPGALPGPDGIALSQSGRIYVALAGTSQISVLRPNGTEVVRYSGPAKNPGGSPNPMPWANPANIAFDDKERRLLVTNHASLVTPTDPSLFSVFDVFVDELGRPVP